MPTDVELIERARDLYTTDGLEIDSCAEVSHSDEGAWVQAWVFVPYEAETGDD